MDRERELVGGGKTVNKEGVGVYVNGKWEVK